METHFPNQVQSGKLEILPIEAHVVRYPHGGTNGSGGRRSQDRSSERDLLVCHGCLVGGLSTGPRWPFPLPLESRNSILPTWTRSL